MSSQKMTEKQETAMSEEVNPFADEGGQDREPLDV
jgi:hypothetical protein